MHALRVGLLLSLLVLSTACATASRPVTDAEVADIDRFIAETLRRLPEVPGIGVSIVRDGKTLARGYGFADLESRRPSDAQTGYYNGSNTKAYTAVLVSMLAHEGVLDLDAPVTRYLPELRFQLPVDANAVTLRRLLSHTSRLENFGVVFRTAYSGEHTPSDLVRILSHTTLGKEGFRYDNLGYVIASLVIERVTGRAWQDVLDERLFEPLGMTRTTARMSEARRAPMATPYDMSETGTMAREDYGFKHDSMMHAAGGIVTTPADLANWLAANVTPGRIGSRQVLPAAAFVETHRQQTPAKRDSLIFDGTGYGLGWYQSEVHGQNVLFHGGGYEGWRSVYTFMPEKKIAVGVMANEGFSHSPLELVSGYILARLMDVPDAETTYREKLGEIRARFDKVKADVVASTEERAKRTSMLAHEPVAYAGTYDHPTYGTLTIEQRGDKLVASIGALSSELQPYTEPESARVELVPGSGEIFRFEFGGAAKARTLKWDEAVFVRR